MEGMTGEANLNKLEKNPSLPPENSLPSNVSTPANEDSGPSGSKEEQTNDQPSCPESISIEEHFSWLIDLIDEPDAPVKKYAHRPSSNDLDFHRHRIPYNPHNSLWGSHEFGSFNDGRHYFPGQNSSETKDVSPQELKSESENKDFSPTKYAHLQTDSKQVEQQFPQSSRFQKLQYITELENCIQALQAKGLEVLAQLQYVDKQNFILSFENEVLKQRFNSMLQEHLIKCIQNDILKREVHRLHQLLFQQQRRPRPFNIPRSY